MKPDPLVQFLERRDQDSFAVLVARTRDHVLRAAYRVLGDRDAAEDVTQDVFLKCLNPPWSADEVRSGRALLAATAVNLAKMRIRGDVRRRAREERDAEHASSGPGRSAGPDASFGRDEIEHVRFAVESLPEGLRRPVELRYFGGLQLTELARALDVSLSTAKARLQEARTVLHRTLSDSRYGVALAYVAAESQSCGIAEIQPTSSFLAQLDRLAVDGIELSRIAAEPSTGWKGRYGRRWSAPAAIGALLLAVAGGVWATLGGGSDGDAPVVAVLPAGVGVDDAGDDGVDDRRDERRRVTVDDADAGGVEVSEENAGAGDAPDTDVDSEPPSITLTVEVVDEVGNLIRNGYAHLDIAGLPDVALMETLAEWKVLRDSPPLSDANPIVIDGLPGIADGLEIEATATVPGFAPARLRTAKLEAGKKSTIRITVVKEREATVTIVDAVTGDPIDGAQILSLTELDRRGVDEDNPPEAPSAGIARTDAAGRAVVRGLGEGPHEIEVRAPGYLARVVEGIQVHEEPVVKLVRLRGTGTVVVEVLVPGGNPAEGQRLTLGVAGRATNLSGVIDATGRCRFEDVPVGRSLAMLDLHDWVEHAVAGEKASDAVVMVDFIEVTDGGENLLRLGWLAPAAPMTVEVRGADGEPSPGSRVEVSGPVRRHAVTDSVGRVVFEGLPAGEYTVDIDPRGDIDDKTALNGMFSGRDSAWKAARGVEVASGTPAHVSAVVGHRTLKGRALRADTDAPVHRAAVAATDAAGRSLLVFTDADGRFELGGALSGALKLSVYAKGDLLAVEQRVVVPEAGETPALEIRLLIGGAVLIHRNADDLDARVQLTDDEPRVARVSKDGDLRIRGLPAGSHRVEIFRGETVIGTHDVEIVAGKTTVIDLR